MTMPMRTALMLAANSMLVLGSLACGGSAGVNPITSTPPATGATVTAVTVSGASTVPGSFQMNATARLSDGTTRDVTTTAAWRSSNTALATVSPAGVVVALGSGDVEIQATYQSVSGSMRLLVSQPAPPTKFVLSGVVREVLPNQRPLAGVRVQVTAGPDTGMVVFTDEGGVFKFEPLTNDRISVQVLKDGYQRWEIVGLTMSEDRRQDVYLFPIAPKDAGDLTATARCTDGSWSWAQTRSDACPLNGGIAYGVCPGPLCDQ